MSFPKAYAEIGELSQNESVGFSACSACFHCILRR